MAHAPPTKEKNIIQQLHQKIQNEVSMFGPRDGSGTAFVCIVDVPKFLTSKKCLEGTSFWDVFFDYGRIWETCLCFFLFENLGKGVGFFSGKQGWIYIEKSVKRMDFVWNEFIRKKKHDQAIEWCNAKAKTSANENHHLHSLLVNPPRKFPEVHLSDFPQSKNCFPPMSVGKKYFGGSSSYPGNYIG